jgi:hypothetical protein
MPNLEAIQRRINLEETQRRIDKDVRAEFERYHDRYKLRSCGVMFSGEPAGLNTNSIMEVVNEKVDEHVQPFRISISSAQLFERTPEGDIPVTFVDVWYYSEPDKD